jgi:hypothetical protein
MRKAILLVLLLVVIAVAPAAADGAVGTKTAWSAQRTLRY